MTPFSIVLCVSLVTVVGMSAALDEALAIKDVDLGPSRDRPFDAAPAWDERATPPPVTIAQAQAQAEAQSQDPAIDLNANDPRQQRLSELLADDAIGEAQRYVEGLVEGGEIDAATARLMSELIWRTKTDRVVEYSEKMRDAIAAADIDSMKDYSARLQRLMAPASEEAASEKAAAALSADAPPHDISSEVNAAVVKAEPGHSDEAERSDTPLRRAIDDDRLFLPPDDNVFELAVARLADNADDDEAARLLDRIIETQQSAVALSLKNGRPEQALSSAEELLDAFSRASTDAPWYKNRQSGVQRWFDRTKPHIVAGLAAGGEGALVRLNLTVAPRGDLSALAYLDLMTTLVGRRHAKVQRLATKVVDGYGPLVESRLAGQNYERALELVERMALVADRFGISSDRIAALRKDAETGITSGTQHDQLLVQATRLRKKGHLIGPEGANALEAAAGALKIAAEPFAANTVLEDLMAEERRRIDRLIKAGQLRDAADELDRFGAAIDRTDTRLQMTPSQLYAEAAQLRRRAVAQEARGQQLSKAASKNPAGSTPPAAEDSSPFTFINPF